MTYFIFLKKGLWKDVLLFSRPWGHTITAVHSCFSRLDIGRRRECFVIVTELPWKAQWQPARTWLGLCSSSAVVSKPNHAAEASSIFIKRIADKCVASYRLICAQWEEKCSRPGARPQMLLLKLAAACSSWQHSYRSTWLPCDDPMTRKIKYFTVPSGTGHKCNSGCDSERHLSVLCFVPTVA